MFIALLCALGHMGIEKIENAYVIGDKKVQ